MSVLEIRKTVMELPLGDRQYLPAWLIESLEDEADEMAARRAFKEGSKTIPWAQLKKELSLEKAI